MSPVLEEGSRRPQAGPDVHSPEQPSESQLTGQGVTLRETLLLPTILLQKWEGQWFSVVTWGPQARTLWCYEWSPRSGPFSVAAHMHTHPPALNPRCCGLLHDLVPIWAFHPVWGNLPRPCLQSPFYCFSRLQFEKDASSSSPRLLGRIHASLGVVSQDLSNNYFLLNAWWNEEGLGRENRPGIRVNLRICEKWVFCVKWWINQMTPRGRKGPLGVCNCGFAWEGVCIQEIVCEYGHSQGIVFILKTNLQESLLPKNCAFGWWCWVWRESRKKYQDGPSWDVAQPLPIAVILATRLLF